jgi:hypothetical protein
MADAAPPPLMLMAGGAEFEGPFLHRSIVPRVFRAAQWMIFTDRSTATADRTQTDLPALAASALHPPSGNNILSANDHAKTVVAARLAAPFLLLHFAVCAKGNGKFIRSVDQGALCKG